MVACREDSSSWLLFMSMSRFPQFMLDQTRDSPGSPTSRHPSWPAGREGRLRPWAPCACVLFVLSAEYWQVFFGATGMNRYWVRWSGSYSRIMKRNRPPYIDFETGSGGGRYCLDAPFADPHGRTLNKYRKPQKWHPDHFLEYEGLGIAESSDGS